MVSVERPLGPLFIDVASVELLAEEKEKLTHPALGGVILFSRNYESTTQLKVLVDAIKTIRTPSLLIGVDQEGGRVQRFKEGFTLLPPVSAYGDLYDRDHGAGIEAARSAGYVMASELRQTGVDLSFAPVLDLAQCASEVIGDRAFHRDPRTVSILARAYIQGMNHAGMKATGKHFPGHGNVLADSHSCVPCDGRGWAEIEYNDLIPYRELSADMLHGVMTAHVQFSSIDNELPTYSSYWLRRVLRQQIGFKGAVFSDDLSMEGAKVHEDPVQRVVRALSAGCDMALMCNDPGTVDDVLTRLELDLSESTPDSILALKGTEPNQDIYQQARASVLSHSTG